VKIHLIAIGSKMPKWVEQGYKEYAGRLPRECSLELHELPLANRGKDSSKADIPRAMDDEANRILARVPSGARIVALDERGKPWSTRELSGQMDNWMMDGRDVALLIGGPDGLSPSLRAKADQLWSLSNLVLPHPLVRIVVAEQLYRAMSIIRNHPYHRD
jgi:23S rRNA (pseudouridine1915-N3)-methyltransferase